MEKSEHFQKILCGQKNNVETAQKSIAQFIHIHKNALIVILI